MKSIINHIFNAPYNWSLIALTIIITSLLMLPYNSTHHFDMAVSMFNYFVFISGGTLIMHGRCDGKTHNENHDVKAYSVVTFLLSILTLFMSKSLVIPPVISLVLAVITIFVFLMMIKSLVAKSN